MPRPTSFQTKLALVYVALFLGVQAAVLLVFNSSVPGRVREDVERQLEASARVCEQIITARVDQLAGGARLLASDFGFRDAVASGGHPTVASALRNQKARIAADFALVTDLDGAVMAAVADERIAAGPPELPDGMKFQAESDGVASRILVIDGRPHEVVLTPISAPVPIAWVALGFELDAEAARSFAALFPLELDVAFLRREPGGTWAATAEAATGGLPAAGIPADLPQEDRGGDAYVRRLVPLDAAADRPAEAAALLSYPVSAALAPYRKLVWTLLAVFGVGLVVLVVGGVAIARNVTRPLRELAEATRQAAAGDYRSVAPPTRDRELSALADNFNRMVAAVREREGRLRHQAEHDVDTGLPNRVGLAGMLARREIEGRPYAVVLAEVQQLPELRTVLDHESLNRLMGAIGERLSRLCGAPVARISTESFALLIEPEPSPDVVASIIRNGFLTPFQVAGTTVDAAVRLGLVARDADVNDLTAVLRRAHSALDRARTAPDGTAWYDPELAGDRARRLSLMSDLREGLRTGAVRFAYQPKFDCAEGRVTAVEALVRWESPTRGFVPPDEFIPLAERTGDVRHLTRWALEQAVARVAAWRDDGRDLAVAVNISATDLADRDLVGRLRDLLRAHRVPAHLLHLELTESAVMADPEGALDVLGALSALGVRLAIDDFGAGYSSLGYLKRLPVDELKIDKSFVMNLAQSEEDRILVRSTIDLGHNLGLRVTAEGVEDAAAVDLLRGYGCDMLQGYHIGRPATVAELENLLREEIHV